jgi:hypothetical protein
MGKKPCELRGTPRRARATAPAPRVGRRIAGHWCFPHRGQPASRPGPPRSRRCPVRLQQHRVVVLGRRPPRLAQGRCRRRPQVPAPMMRPRPPAAPCNSSRSSSASSGSGDRGAAFAAYAPPGSTGSVGADATAPPPDAPSCTLRHAFGARARQMGSASARSGQQQGIEARRHARTWLRQQPPHDLVPAVLELRGTRDRAGRNRAAKLFQCAEPLDWSQRAIAEMMSLRDWGERPYACAPRTSDEPPSEFQEPRSARDDSNDAATALPWREQAICRIIENNERAVAPNGPS